MNENDMKRMQQEAVRRAQEMQNRARKESVQPSVGQHQKQNDSVKEAEQKKYEAHHENAEMKHISEKNHKSENFIGSMFDVLMKDKERTLILCLILLLMDEKADNSLILALLYLLI